MLDRNLRRPRLRGNGRASGFDRCLLPRLAGNLIRCHAFHWGFRGSFVPLCDENGAPNAEQKHNDGKKDNRFTGWLSGRSGNGAGAR